MLTTTAYSTPRSDGDKVILDCNFDLLHLFIYAFATCMSLEKSQFTTIAHFRLVYTH